MSYSKFFSYQSKCENGNECLLQDLDRARYLTVPVCALTTSRNEPIRFLWKHMEDLPNWFTLTFFLFSKTFFLSFVFVKVSIISKGKVKLTNLMSIIIYYIKHVEVFTILPFVCVHSLRSVFFSQNGLNILRSACQTLLKGFLDKTAQSLSNASLIFN